MSLLSALSHNTSMVKNTCRSTDILLLSLISFPIRRKYQFLKAFLLLAWQTYLHFNSCHRGPLNRLNNQNLDISQLIPRSLSHLRRHQRHHSHRQRLNGTLPGHLPPRILNPRHSVYLHIHTLCHRIFNFSNHQSHTRRFLKICTTKYPLGSKRQKH
ncbi:glycogenin [Histoplasma capsulatum]|uniref:Glycogenin n=1 Tax=Ajellomyces capsulatus TaxID=5037 RepID=A0A8A1MKM3_AJECA|nr:glycogenin [Histoplasma capsulatum]